MVTFRAFLTTFVFVSFAFITIFFISFLRNLFTVQKSLKNKTRLRSLLENFDLEIPDELKDFDANVINQARTN